MYNNNANFLHFCGRSAQLFKYVGQNYSLREKEGIVVDSVDWTYSSFSHLNDRVSTFERFADMFLTFITEIVSRIVLPEISELLREI